MSKKDRSIMRSGQTKATSGSSRLTSTATDAGALAAQQHGLHRRRPGDLVSDRGLEELGVIGPLLDGGQACHALHDLVVHATGGVRPGPAEAGDVDHDRARVAPGDRVVGEPEAIGHARPEVLRNHVGGGDEFGQDLAPRRDAQV